MTINGFLLGFATSHMAHNDPQMIEYFTLNRLHVYNLF